MHTSHVDATGISRNKHIYDIWYSILSSSIVVSLSAGVEQTQIRFLIGSRLIRVSTMFLIYIYAFIHCQGRNSAIFNFVAFLSGGQLLKERIGSYRSKFFTYREGPFVEWFYHPGKQTGSYKSCSPLGK